MLQPEGVILDTICVAAIVFIIETIYKIKSTNTYKYSFLIDILDINQKVSSIDFRNNAPFDVIKNNPYFF